METNILPILNHPPPYPVDVCGVGQWAATIRESWGGSGILGHGFLSATAGSRGRACWIGWGLGEFIDYKTLVWEGSVRRVFRKGAGGAWVQVREYRCRGIRVAKNDRSARLRYRSIAVRPKLESKYISYSGFKAIFGTGNKLYSLFWVPNRIERNLGSESGKVCLKAGWKPPALFKLWKEFSLEWRRGLATRFNSELDLWLFFLILLAINQFAHLVNASSPSSFWPPIIVSS